MVGVVFSITLYKVTTGAVSNIYLALIGVIPLVGIGSPG